MGDSNVHAPNDLPLVLAGVPPGAIRSVRHVKYPSSTPLATCIELLDLFGVNAVDRLGDSNRAGCSS